MTNTRRRRVRPWLNLALAAFVAVSIVVICARGSPPLPPLGPALNPGTGVWTAAADAELPQNGTIHIPGLVGHASITFEKNGTAHIQADNDHDVFLLTGYLHARFRLFQMDLERRQGEGLLSQVVGSPALGLDRFELKIGILRTAREEWRTLSRPSRAALQAYARGVNDRMAEDRDNHTLPFLFHFLSYTPQPWTPVDTLVVQGDITQTLDLDDMPLNYAVLARRLGYARTMRWFPVLPPNQQRPYDPGPYKHPAAASVPAQQVTAASASAAAVLQRQMAALGVLHTLSNSNNWAISGAKSASGKPMMAGD